jgi:SAM-dependent methyltransferase
MIKFFNKKYIDYVLLQRTRLKTEYGITTDSSEEQICDSLSQMTTKDLNLLQKYIPNLDDADVLDIGCGLATIDVALSKISKNANYYLLDKTQEIDFTKKFNGFNKEYVFYNNMNLLDEFCKNNIENNSYTLVDAAEINNLEKKFDLIISLLSCGWHYSLSLYLDYIKTHLKENGQLIIDVRNNTEESVLYDTFHNVGRLYNYAEKRHDGGIVGYRYTCSLLK